MLSIPHLIIIFVVALVVFGPEKLPELARNLGKVMAEFRRATGDLRSTFEDHLRDLEREAEQRRIGDGTSFRTPASASAGNTEVSQASVPAPVPSSAPNAPERIEASTCAPAPSEPVEASSDVSGPNGNLGSELKNHDDGHSPEAQPAKTGAEGPDTTRS